MNILATIPLDFGRETIPVRIFAKRGDQDSRLVEIEPLNLGQPMTIPEGAVARLQATKPDGTQVVNDCTIEDGKIMAELTAQVLAVAGIVVAEIGIYQGGSLLSSQIFYVNCKDTAYSEGKVTSSDEFKSLVDAFIAVDHINAWVEQTETGATIYVVDKYGTTHTAHVDTMMSIKSWDDIKYAIRNGLGPILFPVGSEFEVPKETQISISVGDHNTGVTAATIVEETFVHKVGEAHDGHYEATFDGDEWRDEHDNIILLAEYGITTTGTAAEGDKIIVAETADSIIFVVRDHDSDSVGPADPHYTHSMLVETKYVYSISSGTYKAVVFDASEALWYCSEALPAGTYNFVWNLASSAVLADTYQFTLTESVPAGGIVSIGVVSNGTALTSCKISTYSHPGALAADLIESDVVITSGTAGTCLGTVDATTSSDEDLNCGQRVLFGSNNYAQSALRQWLNSDAKLGQVWAATNKFDKAPSWHTSNDKAYAGFLHGMGDDFLGAVLTAKIPYRTNSVFEVDSLDGTEQAKNTVYDLEDKFFVLSRPEIYGTWDSSSYKDGELLDYYDGTTQAEKIKRDKGGTARVAWLRSPLPSYASGVRIVSTDGSLSNGSAYYTYVGVAPACLIG